MVLAVLVVALAGAVLIACHQHAKTQGWTSPALQSLRELTFYLAVQTGE